MSSMPAHDSFDRTCPRQPVMLLTLSPVEARVCALALAEAARGRGTTFAATRWHRAIAWLTGRDIPRPLANPRLEALRRFVCAVRGGHARACDFGRALLDLGYSREQVHALRQLSAG